MKILKLELENFMPYKGVHDIDFRTSMNSKVVLFLGKNGHGKSSILHAIRWCLYGVTSVRKIKKNPESLMNRDVLDLAKQDSDVKMGVTLVWENDNKEYSLTRRWWFDGVSHQPTTSASMRIDGGNPISESQISILVKQFLPADMSHLFLFDGESQREFDDMASDGSAANFIKGEIESTLSIPSLKLYLDAVRNKRNAEFSSASAAQKNDAKHDRLREDVEQLKIDLASAAENVTNLRSQITTATSSMEEAEDLLGDVERFQGLVHEKETCELNIESRKSQLESELDGLRTTLRNNFWLPALEKLSTVANETQAANDHNSQILKKIAHLEVSLESQRERLESNVCPTCGASKPVDESEVNQKISELEQSIKDAKRQLSPDKDETTGRLLRIGFSSQASAGLNKKIAGISAFQAAVVKESLALVQVKRDLDDFNLAGVNGTDALESYKIASKMLDRAKAEFNKATEKKTEITKSLESKQLELSRLTRMSPQKKNLLDCLRQVTSVLELAVDLYVDEARQRVQQYATETFVGILGDNKWTGLEINENFGASPLLRHGDSDGMANTGTQKVTAISLVDGLIRTSMDGGFVLMDSPTGSLDDGNRENFFRWAAQAQMQVCLFMHDGEYDDAKHRQYFGGNVGRVYEITLVSDNQSIVSALREIA